MPPILALSPAKFGSPFAASIYVYIILCLNQSGYPVVPPIELAACEPLPLPFFLPQLTAEARRCETCCTDPEFPW